MEITEEVKTIITRKRLNPFIPIISVLINFALNEDMTIDENYDILNETIESVLMQDYENLEILVASDCYLGQEHVKFTKHATYYGKVVKYVELSVDTGYEVVKARVNGGYVLLMNAGEVLTCSEYLTAAVKKMLTYSDIDIVFANYYTFERPNIIAPQEDGLSCMDISVANSWTKLNGQWLFFNYDKLWCMPGATVFRWKKFVGYIDNNIKRLNKLMFLRMLLETKVAFYNHVVGKCRDGFDNGNGKLTLESCCAALEYIDTATVDALIAGCEKTDIEKWRILIIKKYFFEIVNKIYGNGLLLNELYDIAKDFGVMKLLHETIIEMVRNKRCDKMRQVSCTSLNMGTENM